MYLGKFYGGSRGVKVEIDYFFFSQPVSPLMTKSASNYTQSVIVL